MFISSVENSMRVLHYFGRGSENREGRLLNHFLISNNLEQLISEATHVRDVGSVSYKT